MQHNNLKYLRFQCGTLTLLLPLPAIADIMAFDHTLCTPSGNSLQHHGSMAAWRDQALPYIDLRVVLSSSVAHLSQPLHVLALCDTDSAQTIALVAVDALDDIAHIPEQAWHHLRGIHQNLDIFFDRLCEENNGLTLCMTNPAQWIAQAHTTSARGAAHDH